MSWVPEPEEHLWWGWPPMCIIIGSWASWLGHLTLIMLSTDQPTVGWLLRIVMALTNPLSIADPLQLQAWPKVWSSVLPSFLTGRGNNIPTSPHQIHILIPRWQKERHLFLLPCNWNIKIDLTLSHIVCSLIKILIKS